MKRIQLLQLACILWLVSSCKSIDNDPFPIQSDEVYNYILSRGCPPNRIEDKGSYWVADEDLYFPKNMKIPSKPSGAKEEQAYVPGSLINGGAKRTIRVVISANLAAYTSQITAALTQWNQVNLYRSSTDKVPETNIKFVTVAPNTGYDLIIYGALTGFNPSTYAYSYVPGGGLPGDRVVIDLNANKFPKLSDIQKRGVIMHELGHTLGLEHTDWWQNGEGSMGSGITNIPGTNGNDVISIMKSNIETGASLSGLSTNDRLALRTLYPVKAYNFNWTVIGLTPTLSWMGPLHRIESYTIKYSTTVNDDLFPAPEVTRVIMAQSNARFTIPFRCACQKVVHRARVQINYTDNTDSGWAEAPSLTL